MDTDVLFEAGTTLEKTFPLMEGKGLIRNIRFFIAPLMPQGLPKEKFMLLFPYVMRDKDADRLKGLLEMYSPDRIMIRNIEELGFLKATGFKGEIYADSTLYTFNRLSCSALKELGVKEDTAPLELNMHELKERGMDNSALMIYGRAPLMVSAQCTYKTLNGKCGRTEGGFFDRIKDRKKVSFPVRHECDYCYNVIYNSVPLSLFSELGEIRGMKCAAVRLYFSTESAADIAGITESALKRDMERLNGYVREYTKGHFRKAVE